MPLKFLWIPLVPLKCRKDLNSGVGACVGSPFPRPPGHPSLQVERGALVLGVSITCLCVVPILGSLNSPPFSFPNSLCLLLIFRFYSCYWWDWADINLSELELDFNGILWVSFLEGNTRTPGGSSTWFLGLTEGILILGVCLLHTLTSGEEFQPKPPPSALLFPVKEPRWKVQALLRIQEYKLPY